MLSMLCFYGSTLPIRWAKVYGTLGGGDFLFVRFIIGSLFVCGYQLKIGKVPRPDKPHVLFARVLFHFFAGWFYYLSVAESSAAFGNVLHMSYPLFAGLILFMMKRTGRSFRELLISALGVTGICFTFDLSGGSSNALLFGLLSGVSGALSLLFLASSRQANSTVEIFFYTFLGGLLLSSILSSGSIVVQTNEEIWLLLMSALLGVGGQLFFTYGAAFVSPVEAGVVSCLRIPCALIGATLGLESTVPTLSAWFGALLVLFSNVAIIRRRAEPAP